MGRTRMLPPEIFTDEGLATLSPAHRFAFVGLFCEADREGRLRDQPRRLKLTVLPWDDVDLGKMLDELAAAELIVRYQRDEDRFIAIPGWLTKWRQKPHIREAKSDLPPPPKARLGPPKADLGSASGPDVDNKGSPPGNHEGNGPQARLGQAEDQPRRPDPNSKSDPDPDPDPESPPSGARDGLWPEEPLRELRTALGKTDADVDWQAFVGRTLRQPVEKRLAGAREFLDGGYLQRVNDPLSYCAAMIERSTGKARANGGMSRFDACAPVPTAAETEKRMAAERKRRTVPMPAELKSRLKL